MAFSQIAKLPHIESYIAQGCVPGGTQRNFASYGHFLGQITALQRDVLCDPQTSGGLLMAVLPPAVAEVKQIARQYHLTLV